MSFDFTNLKISAHGDVCEKAASLFAEEIKLRTGAEPKKSSESFSPSVCFELCGNDCLPNKDSYLLELDGSVLKIKAFGLRGLIFGYSYFLRKTVYENGMIILIRDISGKYVPDMKIRGHHFGYCDMANSYEAWDLNDYYRYFRDLMFFGCNINEQVMFREIGRAHV